MISGRVLVTGSAGLIGSEVVRMFDSFGYEVHGIDNNARARFFGLDGDTGWNLQDLRRETRNFSHHKVDIRDAAEIDRLVNRIRPNFLIHCAAQPAHDYARNHPVLDFNVNVTGTLNLLESCRRHCSEAIFIFCSSSKVYGPINTIPFQEFETRFDIKPESLSLGYSTEGVNEDFPLQGENGRGIYGTNKAAADLLVQEYGQTYGMSTVCLRGNCMTGSKHAAVELHGFLAYLAKCLTEGRTYNILGYKGKQVRDIIHSYDFASAIYMTCMCPPEPGSVFNLGGGRSQSISIIEAIKLFEEKGRKKLKTNYVDQPRHGDHRIYISDTSKFRKFYPGWGLKWNLHDICEDLLNRSQSLSFMRGSIAHLQAI